MAFTVTVEKHDGHCGVTSAVERVLFALVGLEVRAQAVTEVVPERDHGVIIARDPCEHALLCGG
jgi:hypothetical protein